MGSVGNLGVYVNMHTLFFLVSPTTYLGPLMALFLENSSACFASSDFNSKKDPTLTPPAFPLLVGAIVQCVGIICGYSRCVK